MPGKGEAVFEGLWAAPCPQERQQDPLCNFCCGEAQRVSPPRACWGSELCVGMRCYNFSRVLCGVWARELIPQYEPHL